MKCKLIRPLKVKNPLYDSVQHQQANRDRKPYRVKQWVTARVGHEIDHPDAWKLVCNGDASPVDAECREAATYHFQAHHGTTLIEGMKIAAHARERLARGIHPRHFEDYDAGRMDGYDSEDHPVLNGERVELDSDQEQAQMVIVIEKGSDS